MIEDGQTIELYRRDTKTLYFLFEKSAAIYSASKSSGTVTLNTIAAHGFSTSALCEVRFDIADREFDGWQTLASTPTSYSLTYALGNASVTTKRVTGTIRGPNNLTSKTLYFIVKRNLDDPDDEAIITQQTQTSHGDAATGRTNITISSTLNNIAQYDYFWEASIKNSDGTIDTQLRGIYRVLQDMNAAQS